MRLLLLHYYGRRYYSPSTGRWLSRDPIEEEGRLNLYAICNNDPVGLNDFLGLKLTPYTSDISTLPFEEGDFDDNGRTGISWPDFVAKDDGNKVTILGSLGLTLYIRAGRNPNKIGSDTRKLSTGEHEREHGRIAKNAWNAKAELVDKWEGEYCPEKCAKLAVMIANAQNMVNEWETRIAEEQMDVTYTHNMDSADWMSIHEEERKGAARFLEAALKNYKNLGCTKTK